LRQMLAQQKSWKKLRHEPYVPPPNPGR
jgi:hypothetical protein